MSDDDWEAAEAREMAGDDLNGARKDRAELLAALKEVLPNDCGGRCAAPMGSLDGPQVTSCQECRARALIARIKETLAWESGDYHGRRAGTVGS